MKKRILSAIFTLMILLSACGRDVSGRASAAAELYKNLTEFSATVQVTMNHGEYLSDYVLTHAFSENTHLITVTEPLGLAGLSMKADGETLELSFGDAVFLPKSLEGTGATPIKLLPDMLSALSTGRYEAICALTHDGRDCVSVSVWSTVDGDEFMHRVSLDAESLSPLALEVFFDGRAVLTAEFSEVILSCEPQSDQ